MAVHIQNLPDVFFYSAKCPICLGIFNKIPVEWDRYFKMISVDYKDARDYCVKLKITKTPTLLIKSEGKIIKYEGVDVPKKLIALFGPAPPKRTQVPVPKVIQESEDAGEVGCKNGECEIKPKLKPKKSDKKVTFDEVVVVKTVPEPQPEEVPLPIGKRDVKLKTPKTINKANFIATMIDHGEEEEAQGEGPVDEKGDLKKGFGHETMASSSVADSLPDLPPKPPSGKKSIMEIAAEMKEGRDQVDDANRKKTPF